MSIRWSVIWLPLFAFILPVPVPPSAVHVACCSNHRWHSRQSSNLGRLVIHGWSEQGIKHLCYLLFCKSLFAPCKGIRKLGKVRLWNPESPVLESGIQLKESRIPLMIETQNPSSCDKDWNPVPGIWNPQCEIQNPRLPSILPRRAILYSLRAVQRIHF